MKAEIERIQNLLEKNHERLQKDFERWLEVMLNQKSLISNTQTTTSYIPQSPLKTTKTIPNTNLDNSVLSQTTTVSMTVVKLLVKCSYFIRKPLMKE